MSIGEYIRESQIWKSIFRHPAPYDRRNRTVVMLTNFFLHLHPVNINQQGIALSYTRSQSKLSYDGKPLEAREIADSMPPERIVIVSNRKNPLSPFAEKLVDLIAEILFVHQVGTARLL